MPDKFKNIPDDPSAPSRNSYAVVPDDAAELPVLPKGIYVGGGGNVTLRAVDATADVTYINLPDASYINVRAQFVRATGTTATNLVAEA